MKFFFHIKRNIFVLVLTLHCLTFISCTKFVEIAPPTDQIVSSTVFTNDGTATAALTGIYSRMMREGSQFAASGITFFTGLSSDELSYYSSTSEQLFKQNQLSAIDPLLGNIFWNPAYRYIYTANLCIEQLNNSNTVTLQTKNILIGEAKLIRAFCYFHLVNLFGDVPLIITTDYSKNANLTRAPIATVYQQIIDDLTNAESFLPINYFTAERSRPNKLSATALLSRMYLYINDWPNAELKANTVINSGLYSLVSDLKMVFKKSSNETIWQIQPVDPGRNTWEGSIIIPTSALSVPTYLVSSELLNSFEQDDNRDSLWINSRVYQNQTLYYPYKYTAASGTLTLSEHYIVLRLAEQHLIRSEARAMQNKLIESKQDLNIIRNRAGLTNSTASSKEDILAAIARERKVELFSEWGHRWYDLKRTGKANSVLSTIKPQTWQATDALYPIPQSQINLNSALSQNPGY